MTLTMATIIGAGIGLGVLFLLRGTQTKRVTIHEQLASTRRPGQTLNGLANPSNPRVSNATKERIGRQVVDFMRSLGVSDKGLRAEQLQALNKPMAQHAFEKLMGAIVGLLFPVVIFIGLAAGGVSMPVSAMVILALVMAVVGFIYPDIPLNEQLERQRRGFRHALSSWLDLVTIILAGGGGIETALAGAARAGDGWAFEEISQALRRAELTGRAPWDALDELGQKLGVTELQELSASARLAGGQGARIRHSLSAKADALRAQQAADIETMAEESTEKMIVPVTVMVLGLTLFIGFGAIDAISTDGGATNIVQVESEP